MVLKRIMEILNENCIDCNLRERMKNKSRCSDCCFKIGCNDIETNYKFKDINLFQKPMLR